MTTYWPVLAATCGGLSAACSHASGVLRASMLMRGLAFQACSEYTLFQACTVWGEEAGRTLQQVEQLLPLIRFPLMTWQELQARLSHLAGRRSCSNLMLLAVNADPLLQLLAKVVQLCRMSAVILWLVKALCCMA